MDAAENELRQIRCMIRARSRPGLGSCFVADLQRRRPGRGLYLALPALLVCVSFPPSDQMFALFGATLCHDFLFRSSSTFPRLFPPLLPSSFPLFLPQNGNDDIRVTFAYQNINCRSWIIPQNKRGNLNPAQLWGGSPAPKWPC